ncbi:hypothetical protein DUNSADRAFT_15191 [Dunaliella salina]|uniref:Uncharacterized protein n=1 Tax=Dunaliella salina TaxID=3046 RepID=A0ABQ7G5V6_DUNSA|nr:hypothetical protein DUNSADRAFT_15191 [Dunaliella salina]|eukprot:KAF5829997.1 hypothetical protein DUNSADRAFT_15191 [Dunaliella salina]
MPSQCCVYECTAKEPHFQQSYVLVHACICCITLQYSRVPVGALGTRGRLGSCRAFSLGQRADKKAKANRDGNSSPEYAPDKAGLSFFVDRFNWGDLSDREEGEEKPRRRKTEGGEELRRLSETEGQLSHQESVPSLDGSTEAAMAAELAAAAAEKTALEADKAALEAAVHKQQEEFELVRSALESRMATLCASISKQEGIIQELQAEEQRAKEANTALNERLAELEAEISRREEEVAELRSQVAGMEGSMRECHEALISKTQAQVSMLKRQVVEVEGSRGAERDRQRNASRAVHAAVLSVMVSERCGATRCGATCLSGAAAVRSRCVGGQGLQE